MDTSANLDVIERVGNYENIYRFWTICSQPKVTVVDIE